MCNYIMRDDLAIVPAGDNTRAVQKVTGAPQISSEYCVNPGKLCAPHVLVLRRVEFGVSSPDYPNSLGTRLASVSMVS